MQTAIVVGGGIGGLTAAAALKRKGWQVRVLERAPSLEPVGSALAVGPNALRALDVLGVGDRVRELARVPGDGGLRRPRGGWVSRTSAQAAFARYADPAVIVLRSEVVSLLRGQLADDEVRLGSEVTGVSAEDGLVVTADGDERADLVVAADGIWSKLRGGLFPGHPEPSYTGLTSWRMLVADPVVAFEETWGRGLVFGVNVAAGDLVYCYATAPAPAGQHAASEKAELTRLFGSWHDPIPRLIEAADPARVLRTDIWQLSQPLPAMHKGRVAILGDAAHPMTPNLGQGGCQAIEDAIVLAHEVTGGGGLAAYTAARLPRTTVIARRSLSLSRLTAISDPVRASLRDAAIWTASRLGPNAVLRQADLAFGWEPPAERPAAAAGETQTEVEAQSAAG
jgi:2-polyprenyl-6-methoxyphenol hydroxylase-like FAD-dependent oxidoreductase